MNEMQIFFTLLIVGVVGHLFMRRSMDFGNYVRRMIAGQTGEGEAGGEVKFTAEQQAHIDKLIGTKAKEYHDKLSTVQKDYEGLKQFKTEYEKSQEANNQKALEDAKKYDEAKKGYETKINDLSAKLSAKDQAIQDRDITYSLTNEISKNNGYTEETIAMIRSRATVDASGNVVIKDKDANGVEVTLSVAEGVKKFLTERPHLVRASNNKGGAGSGAGDGGAGGNAGGAGGGKTGETLAQLNAQLQEAMRGTDLKLRSELKTKIRNYHASRGVSV
jgi:hypothetical protein